MILESTQLLYYAHHKNRLSMPRVSPRPYKMSKSHVLHPMAVWTRKCEANYNYLLQYAFFLCEEYSKRYKKTHACMLHLFRLKKWGYPHKEYVEKPVIKKKKIRKKVVTFATKNLPPNVLPIPLCMPECCYVKVEGCFLGIESYRRYYVWKQEMFIKEKYFLQWVGKEAKRKKSFFCLQWNKDKKRCPEWFKKEF